MYSFSYLPRCIYVYVIFPRENKQLCKVMISFCRQTLDDVYALSFLHACSTHACTYASSLVSSAIRRRSDLKFMVDAATKYPSQWTVLSERLAALNWLSVFGARRQGTPSVTQCPLGRRFLLRLAAPSFVGPSTAATGDHNGCRSIRQPVRPDAADDGWLYMKTSPL